MEEADIDDEDGEENAGDGWMNGWELLIYWLDEEGIVEKNGIVHICNYFTFKIFKFFQT